MKKLIIYHNFKENYIVSYPVQLMYLMFYDDKIKNYLKNNNMQVISLLDYFINEEDKNKIIKDNFKLCDKEIMEIQERTSDNFINNYFLKCEEFSNSVIIGFHHEGFDMILGKNYDKFKSKNCKIYLWQDDLHYFNKINKIPYDAPVADFRLDKVDYILTPSIKYFQNISSPYLSKTINYYYCFNENVFNKIDVNWSDRINKIVLTGSVCHGYPVRRMLHLAYKNYKKNKKDPIGKLIEHIPHIGGDRIIFNDKNGINYYAQLCKYKAAVFGFYKHPLNYPLAKIMEFLICGNLAFLEYNSCLDELGLVKFKHYVPVLKNCKNELVMDNLEYYEKYLNSNIGEKIAKQGCIFARNKFTMMNKVKEFLQINNSN